ncbi:par-3 family cell polarity regulator beta a [Oryzias melastigma]|uniref:Partitioning defective 3 homolog B-like n=1 Tax=Oryzias melastigma TaxID=30732 RepID=A0A3B3BLS5_ORYME|nr:par-3 family cell polarity regulator beta a [Oryzias melastigma]
MKVTVDFAGTAVVVPCKDGWTVRDLTEQATRRYRRILEQHGDAEMKVHHLEYAEGGILDMDDLLVDLVEDRDKLVAIFQDEPRPGTESPQEATSNGFPSPAPSPEPLPYYGHLEYEDPGRGEIEVTEDTLLKSNTPLMVRSSSDSALAPPLEKIPTPPPDDPDSRPPEAEISQVLKGALDRLRTDSPTAKMNQANYSSLTRTVEFPGDRGPLGIHVVPYCSSLSGRTLGLYIKGIEENSRSRREKLFREDECIVQINDTPLLDKTFAQSQEVFRQAMVSPSVCLEVLPAANKPRYEKTLIGQLFSDGKESPSKTRSPMTSRAEPDAKQDPKPKVDAKLSEGRNKSLESNLQSKPQVQPAERASPTPPSPSPTRSQSPPDPKSPTAPGLTTLTTRKGGKKIRVDLKKGTEGLGFTVVTRDSSVHGPGPILVKNILPRGAAIKDGRLQPGDRILEVNGVDMMERSQEELVAMLRSTKQGESVRLLVARPDDGFLPRELKGEEASSQVVEDGREQLMYEIPLNETGSAGLGVSLKGNKSRETGEDLGIFIKSIIHGGAAHKDGRLSINDQLIAVNGETLIGRSNHAAMETLRRSMSSEGNARGTIQLVVLRSSRQAGGATSAPTSGGSASPTLQPRSQDATSIQEPRGPDASPKASRPSRAPKLESAVNGHAPLRSVPTNDSYSNEDDEGGFPPPPSPSTVEEMNKDLTLAAPQHGDSSPTPAAPLRNKRLDQERFLHNRASKSMDLVPDESNLVGNSTEPSAGGAFGPTLGLQKSSSLESLLTAMSEQSHAPVPFHRPRPNMVRGRGCNQSFRNAIDRSYDGPSEDDDDGSDQSSGHETPASSSSRQDLDADEGKKKKKTKGKKKEKKSKGKKKGEDSGDDLEKKPKKKGFGILRFGKKKDDKSKDTSKLSKNRLDALSEEELDQRDGGDARYADPRPGYITPDRGSLPDYDDDDSDPNYARVNNFRQAPSPRSLTSRTPSPAMQPAGRSGQLQPPSEELDGLYAKVNKSRPPPASQNQQPMYGDSSPQGPHREYPQARAAPGYEELDAARRRVLDHDPHRVAPRGAESRPERHYEEVDQRYQAPPRRDPYDYPTHSRPVARDPGPYAPQQRYHPPAQQQRPQLRQDVPPSPTGGRRGRYYNDPARGRADGYRQASPGRYDEDRQPDPRRKNAMIAPV